ncbi:TfoX-like protein [Herbihabitans rhizosphaerae]|uniref:TfoX-like protein n=1 Tax=Herbihabitans rhizosphaerae TaxID=1872711 RepID=A0A4Q7KWT0_9PSEU|nr:TfoX/Sxy family protein [Herbihabitans rhizosphaerae]RZS41155.1 TfoX-like protein [Herbihabitans rhizosphaerae]
MPDNLPLRGTRAARTAPPVRTWWCGHGAALVATSRFSSVVRATISGMAYDEELADRIRELVASRSDVFEQRMFGGLAFLIAGNISVAASGRGGLMVRVDPTQTDDLVDGVRVTPMVMGGRERRGWLYVELDALASDAALADWIERGVSYAGSLPAKRR